MACSGPSRRCILLFGLLLRARIATWVQDVASKDPGRYLLAQKRGGGGGVELCKNKHLRMFRYVLCNKANKMPAPILRHIHIQLPGGQQGKKEWVVANKLLDCTGTTPQIHSSIS